MTKLTTQRGFDKSQIGDQDLASKLSTFIDYVNLATDNLGRIVRSGIGVSDNMDGVFQTVTVQHNIPIQIDLRSIPQSITIGKQVPTSNPVTSFVWEMVSSTRASLTTTFSNNPSVNVNFTLTLWIQYS